jgi:hypothetical protein
MLTGLPVGFQSDRSIAITPPSGASACLTELHFARAQLQCNAAHYAVAKNRPTLVAWLARHGIDMNHPNKVRAWHPVCRARSGSGAECWLRWRRAVVAHASVQLPAHLRHIACPHLQQGALPWMGDSFATGALALDG